MDISERLAAHAAGELSRDEATALEAELARDASLRAEYAAILEVDRLLASLPAAEPSAAFSAQLRTTLRAELAENAAVASIADARARRARWQKPLTMVAAAAAVVGIVGIGINTLGGAGDGDQPMSSALEAADPSADFADGGAAGITSERMAGGPVYAEGGQYDKTTLTDLAGRDDIRAALGQAALDPAGAQQNNLAFLAAAAAAGDGRGLTNATGAAPAPLAADEQDSAVAAESLPGQVQDVVSRCVPLILDDQNRVPLFADLGGFEGQDALIVVLGAPDANGDFERLEFWVLAVEDCHTLFFAQEG